MCNQLLRDLHVTCNGTKMYVNDDTMKDVAAIYGSCLLHHLKALYQTIKVQAHCETTL